MQINTDCYACDDVIGVKEKKAADLDGKWKCCVTILLMGKLNVQYCNLHYSLFDHYIIIYICYSPQQQSLVEGRIIASYSSFKEHFEILKWIEKVIYKNQMKLRFHPVFNGIGCQTKGSKNCRDSKFAAARSHAPKERNLDETGIQVCCCSTWDNQTGCKHVPRQNLSSFELYRTVPPKTRIRLHMRGCTCVIINSLVQNFPDWRIWIGGCYSLSWKSPILSGKDACGSTCLFLPGKTFYSFVTGFPRIVTFFIDRFLNFSHWLTGACLTTGEEQEQVNSYISRFNQATKYMGKGREYNIS